MQHNSWHKWKKAHKTSFDKIEEHKKMTSFVNETNKLNQEKKPIIHSLYEENLAIPDNFDELSDQLIDDENTAEILELTHFNDFETLEEKIPTLENSKLTSEDLDENKDEIKKRKKKKED